MTAKTNISFELQFTAQSSAPQAERERLMQTLDASVAALFTPIDTAATVAVSDSHKGSENKIVELVSTLPDTQIAEILLRFCEQHGITMTSVE